MLCEKSLREKLRNKSSASKALGAKRCEQKLYDALAKLDLKCRDADGKIPKVKQPAFLNDLATLTSIANTNNDFIHVVVRAFVLKCGGRYDPGPVKLARRIQAKANHDYECRLRLA